MRTIYQAFDGKIFEFAVDCKEYERSKICSGIFAFDADLNQISLKDIIDDCSNATRYVKITNPDADELLLKYFPNWDFTEAFKRGDINLEDKIWVWDFYKDIYMPFELYINTQMRQFDYIKHFVTTERDE